MDNVELCKKLRELSRSGSPFRRVICKVAAQRIENLSAQLAQAVEDLRQADVDRRYCSHKELPAPCAEDDDHYECEQCPHGCYCKDCFDNSKWEYYGLTEERILRQARNDKEEGSMYLCKDCNHLMVCKYTDAGDGRCQKPQYFRDKQAAVPVINISTGTRKAMERMGSNAHGGATR